MDQDNSKPWWQSAGVWGSLVAMGASAISGLGYTLSPDDQAVVVSGVEQAIHIGSEVVAFAGGAVALWGRVRATKLVGSK